MARFAPVVPLQIASRMQGDDVSQDLLGGYHLLLAHDVLACPEEYKKVYNKVRRRWTDSFIILDNSVVELGMPMRMDDLVKACKIIEPNCLVIPDSMGDGAETRRLGTEFAKEYSKYCVQNDYDNAPPLMGVIQGEKLDDCMHTAIHLFGLPFVEFLSVPRIIAQQQGSRMPLLEELLRSPLAKLDIMDRIHLLGFSDNLLDDIACARLPCISGIDSAVPVRAGIKRAVLTLDYKQDHGKRGDFWETPDDDKLRMAMTDIRTNCDLVRKWIGDQQ